MVMKIFLELPMLIFINPKRVAILEFAISV